MVKLLLDENLSRRLVHRIGDLFPETHHIGEFGLLHAADTRVWEFAKANAFCIVTADSDFYERATRLGHPPKLVWLKGCDYPTQASENLIRSQAVRIFAFLNDPESAVLILQRQHPKHD